MGCAGIRRDQKWKAEIYFDGKSKTIGSYVDETEAARAYDATVRAQSLDKPLNFPDDLSTAPGVYVPKKKRVASSRFRGVSWDKTKQKWKAQIYFDGKSKNIGSYDDETEAARAYDATVRAQSLDKPLNFPDDLSTAPGVYVPKKKRVASSRFRGVMLGQDEAEVGGEAQNRWEAKFIGSYDDETEAARAYDATVRAQSLDKPLNFPDDLSTAPGVYVPKKKRVATSRFRGVCWDKTNQKWKAAIYFDGKSKPSAATTTRRKQRERTTPLFERRASISRSTFRTISLLHLASTCRRRSESHRRGFVGYAGTSQDRSGGRMLRFDGKSKNIGSYDDETEAARAYDATVRAQSLDKPLNFPDDLSTAPGVYVPKKKKRVAIVEISWGELGQDESEVDRRRSLSMGSRSASAATTTRRKQRERTTPLFERRASISRSTFRTISLLHLASTCRRRSESRRRDFVG